MSQPRSLAYSLLWTTSLFILLYAIQPLLYVLIGPSDLDILMLIVLGFVFLFAISSVISLRDEAKGLSVFGSVSLALFILLFLTHYQFLGLILLLIYIVAAIGKLFKEARKR